MLGDKATIVLIGLLGIAVTATLAIMGHKETAAVVGTMTMGLVNIFLRVSSNEANAKVIGPDGKRTQMQIESDNAELVKDATQAFVGQPSSHSPSTIPKH